MTEKRYGSIPGGVIILAALVTLIGCGALALLGVHPGEGAGGAPRIDGLIVAGPAVVAVLALFSLGGLYVVNPNQAKVLQLFGRYVGTVRDEGLRWNNPFLTKLDVTLRVRTFETSKVKVNDLGGNPIEIAAIVVWKVVDTAQACFVVDDYSSFVHIQTEAAVRDLATHHPYDAHDEATVSLRGHIDLVADQLKAQVERRVRSAGIEIVEARIAHLAYAPEIAQAMLQRQQAGAIIAARQLIVEGAVGMVEMALARLARNNVVELDEDRKAAMVSNLLVVLCGERSTQPVINTGTLHQ